MSIHRINNSRGYFDDNVTFVTLSCNSRLKFVPFWKSEEEKTAAIAEVQLAILEAYPELREQIE